MTYTGAMVLPKNAVVMPEQEMRYVEGGGLGKHWYNKVNFIAGCLDAALIASGFFYSRYAAKKALNIINNLYGTCGRVLKAELKKWIGKAAASALTTAINIGLTLAGSSPGQLIAKGLDWADGKYNGYLFS